MKKILVTSSSGYIGQHLCKLLKQTGEYEIHGMDIVNNTNYLDEFNKQNVTQYSKGFELKINKYDTVVHLAAMVRVNESVELPAHYYRNNLFGTMNILEQIKYNNFIFASTGAATNPTSPYGLSKRAAEDVVSSYCKKNDKSFTMFRFYNVIGSDGIPPTNPDGLFYNLINAEKTGTFKLYGTDYNTPDGSPVRDYVHVMEICDAIKTAIDLPANGLENLGHGHGFSVKEIVDIYKNVNDCDFDVIEMPRREGDLEKTVLDKPSSYLKSMYIIEELLKK
jgi:UDP-glucose 4-epimerase